MIYSQCVECFKDDILAMYRVFQGRYTRNVSSVSRMIYSQCVECFKDDILAMCRVFQG